MKLAVVKTGFPSFDTLHAFGLAIVFAESCNKSVQIRDHGTVFELTLSKNSIPRVSYLVLEIILRLPDFGDLLRPSKGNEKAASFLNLDGLLAASFNLPGPKVASVIELVSRTMNEEEKRVLWLKQGYKKAVDVASRVISGFQKQLKTDKDDFLRTICVDYRPDQPRIPEIREYSITKRWLPIWATLEPALGFSTRSPKSDCELTSCNLTILGTRFASFLALIGAARILRAHKTDSRNIVFWLPRFEEITIHPGFALPTLHFFRSSANRAILFRAMTALDPETKIKLGGLHYHFLQGTTQPIPVAEGDIDLVSLRQIPDKLVRFWRHIATAKLAFDHALLSSALFGRNYHAWVNFLLSWHDLLIGNKVSYRYSVGEIMEVNQMLDPFSKQPLSAILNEKAGTRKFGALLRQLNEINRSEYLQVYDQIRTSKLPQDVLLALSKAMNEILVMKGKKATFRVFPTTHDVTVLLEQIENYEVRNITPVLIILGSLHFLGKENRSASKLSSGE